MSAPAPAHAELVAACAAVAAQRQDEEVDWDAVGDLRELCDGDRGTAVEAIRDWRDRQLDEGDDNDGN